jgi:hypothetical protein
MVPGRRVDGRKAAPAGRLHAVARYGEGRTPSCFNKFPESQ